MHNIKEITENYYTPKNFKTYHDIYYVTQLDKLDPNKLYRMLFRGSNRIEPDIPDVILVYNNKFYKDSYNLNTALKQELPKSLIKKAFDKYGNGSIAEYEMPKLNESLIKPSDMDTVLSSDIEETVGAFPHPANKYKGKSIEWYDGFQTGWSDGYTEGFEEGKSEGRSEGYDLGYDEAVWNYMENE